MGAGESAVILWPLDLSLRTACRLKHTELQRLFRHYLTLTAREQQLWKFEIGLFFCGVSFLDYSLSWSADMVRGQNQHNWTAQTEENRKDFLLGSGQRPRRNITEGKIANKKNSPFSLRVLLLAVLLVCVHDCGVVGCHLALAGRKTASNGPGILTPAGWQRK